MKQRDLTTIALGILKQSETESVDVQNIAESAFHLLKDKNFSQKEMKEILNILNQELQIQKQGPIVTIMTSREIPSSLEKKITSTCQRHFSPCQMNYIVRPEIMGGIIITKGDDIYDYSLRHSLDSLHTNLTN